jgi:hypothetical protein
VADVPNYGAQTVIRPRWESTGRRPPGATEAMCPYCGCGVWAMPAEAPLAAASVPGGFTFACAECALKRGSHQREMDASRAAREAGGG